MSESTWALFEAGPEAILTAAREARSGVNWSGLAQACSREVNSCPSRDLALGWAEATIACRALEAAKVSDEWTRTGIEESSFGVRGAMLLRFGLSHERLLFYQAEVNVWLGKGLAPFVDPAEWRQALATGAPHNRMAIFAQVRLRLLRPLWDRGLLDGAFRPWFGPSP
jgi:hypothetical protein